MEAGDAGEVDGANRKSNSPQTQKRQRQRAKQACEPVSIRYSELAESR
jgi:hypothetical protein